MTKLSSIGTATCANLPSSFVAFVCLLATINVASAQLIDSLDAYPPRWSLHESDCDAKVADQGHEHDPSAEGGVCEAISLVTGHGTQAILVYPIEPVRPIDELSAMVSVKGLNTGIQIGFRVRFPYLIDPETRRPASVLILGSQYRRVGEFQRLGISHITAPLRLKIIALRNEYGIQADVSSPYVDAVVVNAYGKPGNATLRLDDLRVNAMVPVTELDSSPHSSSNNSRTPLQSSSRMDIDLSILQGGRRPNLTESVANARSLISPADQPAFPIGRVTRIIQYNNEPLSWIRSLGFDAIWLAETPTAAILSDAIAHRMRIYAPCPTVPDPKLEPLLEPVAGWIAAPNLVMDSHHREQVTQQVARLRALPRRWQRPIVGSPVEDFRHYGAMLDAAVLTAPPRIRALSSEAVRTERSQQRFRLGGKPIAISVLGMPNASSIAQSNAIANRIGTPATETFAWQPMWREVADAMADAPSAILVRSTRSLASGETLDQNRGMAISFLNRFVASLEKWISTGTPDVTPVPVGPYYTAHRLTSGSTTFLICTSAMVRGTRIMSGDGKTLRIDLPAFEQGKLMWRLTHFAAERIEPETTPHGTSIEIVSPDVVEVIAISDQISEGGQLASSLDKFSQQASLDRWQLARDSIEQSGTAWARAIAARAVSRDAPNDLLEVARSTINNSERMVRSNDAQSALRLAARADAWSMKANWMLCDAFREDPYGIVSSPPLDAGNFETQIAWSPLLNSGLATSSVLKLPPIGDIHGRSRWGVNLLSGGGMDRPDSLQTEGWTFGRRHSEWAETTAECVDRGVFHGTGALAVRVIPKRDDALPGGYEGTALLVRSPPIFVEPNQAVRIDAVVRTLGFGGPHQGLLMYDSLGTQELGVLIRDRPDWTPVTLYRQTVNDEPIHVMFEVLGGGEAIIDEIQVRAWETDANPLPAMRPISHKQD
ncbi:hypothetical protein [Rhodopirellula islandica]|uniref:hypothetical protein n=1 Tax=Rhodopirellula islandica TaxID=595434 RepID=UPI0036F33B88